MKKLNVTAVGLMITSLITANGKTSNKEIKEALRGIGYHATQDEVKQFVNEIIVEEQQNPSEAIFAVSYGDYREYTFTDFAKENGYITATSINEISENEEIDEEKIDTVIDSVNLIVGQSRIPNAVIAVSKTLIPDGNDDRDPKMIYQTEDLALQHNDPKQWVAFHKDKELEFHIYSESLNSDKVRSRYASLLKVSIADVRARRVANLSK